MRSNRLVLVLLVVVLIIPVLAIAQEQRGAIEGVVKDGTGAVLPGVTLEARSPAFPGVATAVSDARGLYRFPGLVPGVYEVTATLQGFNTTKVGNIQLELGRLLKVDLTMAMAGVSETVTVTGESPLIDVKQSASFANIRAEQIDKLPRGRDFTSIVAIAPGANDESKVAGISIDGASGSENRYVMDGIDTTNLQTGRAGKALVTDMVEEVQVKSSGYNAEFGGATGGVVNVITKTGSNQIRGVLVAYYSSRALEGAERPTLRLNPLDDRLAEYVTYPKDTFTRIEPGFVVGGPVVRDKAWFFASYIPTLYSTDRPITFRANNQSATFHQTQKTHNVTANLTTQVGGKLRLKGAVNVNPYYQRGSLPGQDGTSPPGYKYAAVNQDQPNYAYSGNVDYVASNSLYFAARGGYFYYDTKDSGVPDQVRHVFSGANFNFAQIPPSLQFASGYADVYTNRAMLWDKQTRFSLNADVTYYVAKGGQHTFKGGIQFDRPGNDVNRLDQQPVITFYWDRTYTTTTQQRVRGTYGYYNVGQFFTTGDIHTSAVGLFFQDSWSVTKDLTLNLGLRTESEQVPSYKPENPGIKFGFGEKLAPRAGFSWDVNGNGKWKAYGSWGVYYDITKLDMPRASLGGDKSLNYRFSLDTYNWPTIGGTCSGPAPSCSNIYPGTFYEVYDSRHAANSIDTRLGNKTTVDPNLHPMKSQEFTLGLDHELGTKVSVGVRYVHKWLNYLIEDVGIIVPGIGEVFFIANPGFGVAEYTLGPDFPAQPPAVRKYDGVEFRFTKRTADRWSLSASYLWSRLWGNTSGLASSDELTAGQTGRAAPNNNRQFDSMYMSFDQNGQPVFGPLGVDRPHQFKTQFAYDFAFGTTVGFNEYLASGTPVSRQANIVNSMPVFYMGRMSDGRTPFYSQSDLFLQHELKLPGNKRVRVSVNVLNVFDQQAVTAKYPFETRDVIPMQPADFFKGCAGQVPDLIARNNIRLDPQFLKNWAYQDRRAIRLSATFVF